MNKISLLILLCCCQVAKTCDPPLTAHLDFASVSPEELSDFLESTQGAAADREVVARTIESRRNVLIQFCFKNPSTSIFVPDSLNKIADESHRDEVALLLIKSESRNFWANEEPFGSVIWHGAMVEPFIPTFKRHLPNAKPLLEILATKELRLKTAVELEAAMAGRTKPETGPAKPPEPVPSGHQNGPTITPMPKTPSVAAPPSARPQDEKAGHWGWLLIPAGLVMGVLLLRWSRRDVDK